MSALHEAMGQRDRALLRLLRRPSCWPLLDMPTSLVVYVLAVLGCDLALAGWELEFTVLLPRTDAAGAHGIGVALLGQHGRDLFELLAAADVALYKAKDAGRDQAHVYAQAAAGPKAGEMEDEATDACP